MQVYLPAIESHVPDEMVKARSAYIAQRNVHDTNSLKELDDALQQFHCHHKIFRMSGVHPTGFNLSRQHSLT
jgi:hypothetical protein